MAGYVDLAVYLIVGHKKMNAKILIIVTMIMIFGLQTIAFSAEKIDVYIKPEQVKNIPANIAAELNKLNCQIPQGIMRHTNAVEGAFAIKGQKDWAVLCSINGQSSIHIFWGGSKKCKGIIAKQSDEDYLYKHKNGSWEYNRGLGKVGKKYIIEHYEAYGGPKPPHITHDAINDIWLEKASVVHYCNKGQWVQLTGAD